MHVHTFFIVIFVLFASTQDIKFSSDILAFNMETFIWRKLPSTGFRVPERDFHTATTVNRKLLVFGGRSKEYLHMYLPFGS